MKEKDGKIIMKDDREQVLQTNHTSVVDVPVLHEVLLIVNIQAVNLLFEEWKL